MKKLSLLLLTISFFSFNTLSSQEEIIDYFHKKSKHVLHKKIHKLNALSKGIYNFYTDDTKLIIEFLENNNPYRQDEIYLETLNPERIKFSEEEDAIICKCRSREELNGKLKKFRDGCVQRHIFKKNIVRGYYRINFQIHSERDLFIEIIKELIISAQTHHS